MASITFEGVERRYPGSSAPAVADLDLHVDDGEFMVLVGPSGCGKTTTLRMLAGLERVDRGRILIGGRDVTHVSPKDRDIAMVFQNYALYPHMTTEENMGFALKLGRLPAPERRARVWQAAEMLHLTEFLGRRPRSLSGGQRQRVAMGRAIVRQPRAFCMDEPLSNLDAKMRVQTRAEIARLQRQLGVTTIYVTHDQVEAMTMGDRVAVMDAGVLQQVDTPLGLYDRPTNAFVAGFIGSPQMNLLPALSDGHHVSLGPISLPVELANCPQLLVGVRPDAWRIVPKGEETMAVEVSLVEHLGAETYIYGVTKGSFPRQDVTIRASARDAVSKGETIYVTVEGSSIHLFEAETGARVDVNP